jgi:hypothetical protein
MERIMVEGPQYLLNVLAYYRQAITETRGDVVMQDIGLGLWRIDEFVRGVSPETLEFAEERLLRVHDCVLRGAYPEAQIVLADLRARVVAEKEVHPHSA